MQRSRLRQAGPPSPAGAACRRHACANVPFGTNSFRSQHRTPPGVALRCGRAWHCCGLPHATAMLHASLAPLRCRAPAFPPDAPRCSVAAHLRTAAVPARPCAGRAVRCSSARRAVVLAASVRLMRLPWRSAATTCAEAHGALALRAAERRGACQRRRKLFRRRFRGQREAA